METDGLVTTANTQLEKPDKKNKLEKPMWKYQSGKTNIGLCERDRYDA